MVQQHHFPKLKTLIQEQSAGHPNVIVTLAGDFVAPSLLSGPPPTLIVLLLFLLTALRTAPPTPTAQLAPQRLQRLGV